MASLHPLTVHFPIVLTLLWPVLDAVGLYRSSPDLSRAAMGCLGLALLSSLVATMTGQAAFDAAVEARIEPALLNTHADVANVFPWVLLAMLVLRTAGVVKYGRKAHLGAVLLGFAGFALAWSVGGSGGALVYQHGVGVERAR